MRSVNIVLRPVAMELLGLDTIGVDSGALFCLDHGIKMKATVGDFDSIAPEDLKRLHEETLNLHVFPKEKNETDFEIALQFADAYDRIYVYGALGERRDHEYGNVMFAYGDSRLVLLNETNRIHSVGPGIYTFKKNDFTYFSLITFDEGEITLEGFKYPLKNEPVNIRSRHLTSNEIVDEGTMTVHRGRMLIIESKESLK